MSAYEELIELLKETADKTIERMELPKGFIEVSVGDNYASVWIREIVANKRSMMICKALERGKAGHKYGRLMLKTAAMKHIETAESLELIPDKKDAAILYLDAAEINADISGLLENLFTDYVRRFEPAEKFGCCHLYRECSAAKKCLHYNLFYAKACWYRKNLEKGNIFY